MVVVRLCGGFGNQAFQYAFGSALKVTGNDVAFDLSWFIHQQERAYALDHWNTDVEVGKPLGTEIGEGGLRYKPGLIKKYDQDCTFVGYWQCSKYFESLDSVMRRDFTLRELPCSKTFALADQIKASNSVFLHVRRTDSLNSSGVVNHGVCSIEYYRAAMNYIRERVKNPRFFVFSDDITWCLSNLDFPDAIFVSHNSIGVTVDANYNVRRTDNGTEHEDLWLMSQCKHGITANSSFSWWGGYLINNPDKIMISPRQWFAPSSPHDATDIVPSSWVRL
jgi:Glycosyl transferase family 11